MDLNIKEEIMDKSIDTAIKALPLPGIVEDGIIIAKNVLKDENVRENIANKINDVLNGINKVQKNSMKDNLIASTVDAVLDIMKENKILNKKETSNVKLAKQIVIDIKEKEFDELKNENSNLTNLKQKLELLEKNINNGKENNIKLEKEILKQYSEIDKTREIIEKAESLVINKYKENEEKVA